MCFFVFTMLNLYHTNRIKTTMQNPQLISTNLYHNSSLSIKSQFLETHTPNHQWCLITFSRNSVCLNIKVTHNDTNYTKYLEFTNQLTFTCFVENLIHNFTMKMKPHCMYVGLPDMLYKGIRQVDWKHGLTHDQAASNQTHTLATTCAIAH